MTKMQLVHALVEAVPGLKKGDVAAVLDALPTIITTALKAGDVVVLPGVARFKAVTKAATPERRGVDPFSKQPKTFPAKPETRRVKVAAIKPLKTTLES